VPVTWQSAAVQHTPLAHDAPLQLTLHVAPWQLMSPGQLPLAHDTVVSRVAALSIKFWQAWVPLHSNRHELASPPQLSLAGQLFWPLQRMSHLSASQRISFLHAPCAPHTTSQELPPQLMLPEQVFSALHCTEQLDAF
jgi:hypothetical protein